MKCLSRWKNKLAFIVMEWSGGLYVSPTITGSRPGGLIAGAWAAMLSLGQEGYLEHTRDIMEASKWIQNSRVKDILELHIVARLDMTIMAFGSNVIYIFEVNDMLSSKGWNLHPLQRPNRAQVSGISKLINVAFPWTFDDRVINTKTILNP
ncbi:sphingosine-1-phosphate lyase [Tanacetum coccineum]|uniref:Sphingosine-1-phosphate lyase n=1 Tax=Tanacetum coccineum TaxID=301880 RepID=A0ABQ5IGF5_9ASTR